MGYKDLRLIFFFCFFALIFCLPKIYLTSQIYYLSRNIIKTENHLILLQEENRHLKKELEDFKFQQILNME
ncbi:hypothetical protein BBW65_01275 [Helicobacter enhydrae]|uniref:Septum formation initiator n=1 Tax=Helicobacter enhydrae TaxID=222136 RepID=A0A1B1U7L3_9HELI|nr:hypothetical protein BBW65_01275 [Helicobacter enhydrae]